MLTCPLCHQQFKKIDSQHLKKRHLLTKEQYLQQFPDGPIGACDETKKKLGAAVKSRGPRSGEAKRNISIGLKGKSRGRAKGTYVTSSETRAKQSVSRKAYYAENGVSDEWSTNISVALKKKYQEAPKEKLDKSSARYHQQVEIVKNLARLKKEEAKAKLLSQIETIDWGKFICITDDKMVQCSCSKCSTIITRQIQTYRKHKWQNTICHNCFPPLNGTSKAEEDLNDFFNANDIKFQRHVKGVIPNGLELDFFCPERNIAVEYHGLYWHSSACDYKIDKHRLKYEYCRDLGIRLIQIFEDEWVKKRSIVESRLLSILGKNRETIAARKCSIVEVNSRVASEFLDAHHLQGGTVKTKHNYALTLEHTIVAVMTFQKPRIAMRQKKEDGVFELVRFATNGRIIGAFSKLLKYASNALNIKAVTSWADLRWSNPNKNVYLANGFKVKSESKMGYSYTNLDTRFHRFGCRKPKDFIGTEVEWNKEQGRFAIYDAGTINYIKYMAE